MKVLVVEPGYAPYEKDIEGLHGMQEVVGGTITAIYPFAEPVAVVGNDDSISLGMPFNRSMEGGYQALSLGLPLRQQEAARSGTSRCTGGTPFFLDEQTKRNMVRFGTRGVYPRQQRA